MKKPMSVKFSSYFDNIQDVDDNIAKASLRVAFHGMNRNNSNIYKTAFESAVSSMYNKPVVTNYLEEVEDSNGDAGDFGGHDVEIKKVDGQYKIVNKTSPIGVIPESATWSWEEYETEEEGLREYFKVNNVLLWKRQEAYSKVKELNSVNQSMEIQVNDGEFNKETGYYDIKDFTFEAFCLLGTTVEPCFSGSQLELQFNKDNFKAEFQQMLNDIKNVSFEINQQGGVSDNMEENMELEVQQGTTEEQVEQPKEENFEENPVEEVEEKKVEEQSEEKFDFNNVHERFKKLFELSHEELRGKIYEKLSELEEDDEEWYYITKVYDNYFVYENDTWFSAEPKIFKQGYIKTENDVAFDGERVKLYRMELTEEEKAQIDTMRSDYSALKTKVDDLTEKLSTYQANEIAEQREGIYSQFAENFTEEEMASIKEETKDVENAELEEKLFALVGKKKAKFSKSEKKEKAVVKIVTPIEEDCPYPGLLGLYNKVK